MSTTTKDLNVSDSSLNENKMQYYERLKELRRRIRDYVNWMKQMKKIFTMISLISFILGVSETV